MSNSVTQSEPPIERTFDELEDMGHDIIGCLITAKPAKKTRAATFAKMSDSDIVQLLAPCATWPATTVRYTGSQSGNWPDAGVRNR